MRRRILRWSIRLTLTAAAPLLAVLLMACPAPPPPTSDADGDGVPNAQDTCPNTPAGEAVDNNGCAASQRDSDNDGVSDDLDECPTTPADTEVDEVGCPTTPPDADGDGVPDAQDTCPNTPAGENVDNNGCATGQLDDDGDGVPDADDTCPNTPAGEQVDDDGCGASQRDSDGDTVSDDIDECPTTPSGVTVDEVGCPVSAPGTPDDDDDGVPNDIDQCPDTPAGATVDANGCVDSDGDGIADVNDDCEDTPAGGEVNLDGCADSQLDGDGDGVSDDIDECPNTPRGEQVDETGCAVPPGGGGDDPVCGDGTLDAGEECDDGNTDSGDGCGSSCLWEPNDGCATPRPIEYGTTSYSNEGATTDGPEELSSACALVGDTQIGSDVWYCFTSTCSGPVVVSACGATYDAKMAVYAGCGCPTGASIACSDDDCGPGQGSRLQFPAQTGESYMIRLGGFDGAQGTGTVTIFCADDANHDVTACGPGAGDCFSANGSTACEDVDCCVKTCEVDPFCCDTDWDSLCAQKADGLCGDGFDSCGPGAGDCTAAAGNGSPGCENTVCCQAVCERDPYCCLTEWDDICAEDADYTCTPLEVCANATGDCDSAHDTPGCNVQSCCEAVCAIDPACCNDVWDDACVGRTPLLSECQ